MAWKEALVRTLREHGGRQMTLAEIYQEMVDHPLVTLRHHEPWTVGNQPRYQCWIRRYLTDLVREGVVERVRRGTYCLGGK